MVEVNVENKSSYFVFKFVRTAVLTFLIFALYETDVFTSS